MEEEAGQEPHAFSDLGLAVDHATLTAPFFQLTLFEDQSLEACIIFFSFNLAYCCNRKAYLSAP